MSDHTNTSNSDDFIPTHEVGSGTYRAVVMACPAEPDLGPDDEPAPGPSGPAYTHDEFCALASADFWFEVDENGEWHWFFKGEPAYLVRWLQPDRGGWAGLGADEAHERLFDNDA